MFEWGHVHVTVKLFCFSLNTICATHDLEKIEQLAAGFVLVLYFLIYELDCKIFMDNLVASLNKWMLFSVLNRTLLKILSPNSFLYSKLWYSKTFVKNTTSMSCHFKTLVWKYFTPKHTLILFNNLQVQIVLHDRIKTTWSHIATSHVAAT
jgi:hypothetical protein